MLKTLVWAKSNPHKSLVAHMIDTGLCAQEYLLAGSSASLLSYLMAQWHCGQEEAVEKAAYLCAVHDMGKATPSFQSQSEEEIRAWEAAKLEGMLRTSATDICRHEYYSQEILSKRWRCELEMDCDTEKALGMIISQHHQREAKGKPVRVKNTDRAQFWQNEQECIEAEIRRIFLPKGLLELPQHVDGGCMVLLGLTILCDWVASSAPFENLDESDENYISNARKQARKTLKDYGLIEDTAFPGIVDFAEMWPQIQHPRPLQKACMQLDDQALLTIIEAPMGEGKTEAALYLAGKMCGKFQKRGIYVALPTQATSNGMHQRVEAMLEQIHAGSARLMHGTAFLMRDELKNKRNEVTDWLKPMRLAMLGGNAVGTIDQAMAAMLQIRFGVLRLFGLQNKVLVIDEVHAYDSYMSKIIEILLKWCHALNIPVVLLSATMRREQRRAYLSCYGAVLEYREKDAYPMITQVSKQGEVNTVEFPAYSSSKYRFRVCAMLDDMARIAREAVDKVSDGGCLCVLMNTVRQAQEVYTEILRLKQDDCETMLFHARFTVERREEIAKSCLRWFGKEKPALRPKKAILVATAVVEQSLDLGFDAMITQIAPMDLLLQRAGRVHRHRDRLRPGKLKEPVIDVLVPDEEQGKKALEHRYGLSGYVYDPYLLDNTERLIRAMRDMRIPEDVRPVIEEAYHGLTDENMAAFMRRQMESAYNEAEALSSCIASPDPNVFWLAEQQSDWLIHEIDDGFEPRMRPSTRMGENSVRVIFCGAEMAEKALEGKLLAEEEKAAFMKSAALPLRELDKERMMNLSRVVRKGMLKGCVIADSQELARISQYHLINDQELGILIEKDDKVDKEV